MSISGWIKRTIYWTNDYMHGKKVRRFYEDLETVHESKEKGYPIQQKHLKDILAHAVTNSAFYSGAVSGGGIS